MSARRNSRTLLPWLLLAAIIGWLLWCRETAQCTSATLVQVALGTAAPTSCRELPRFRRYEPSAWEKRTAALLPDPSKGGPCALAAEKPQNVKAWLSGIEGQVAALVGDNATATNGGAAAAAATRLNRVFNPSVFSHLEWEDPCQPGAVISQPIEPLIGHFRHPLGPQCIKDSTVHIESRDYILFSGLTPQQFQRMYPGRRLLLDMGTSHFSTSLALLLNQYKALGIEFDEIWAWEVNKIEPESYWAEVPPTIKPRLHFYNVPISGDPKEADHPVHLIKQMAKPGDFVAIKLDVDNSPVELAFMNEVKRDPELRALIGELFFEQHYSHDDINRWFGASGAGVSHQDVFDHFTDLRKLGVRLHYWP